MADCNKTVNFINELRYMCHYSGTCDNCPLNDVECACQHIPTEDIDKVIQIVQKWSDEHSETSELKACPFCGKTDCVYINEDNKLYQVVCDYTRGGCGASSGYIDTKEEAIENWNKRFDDDLKEVKDEKK